jgi:hypothetical protein
LCADTGRSQARFPENRVCRKGQRMDRRPVNLSLIFQTKGFSPVEIPGLVKDIVLILKQGRHSTLNEVNRELEDLGWGIDIMDRATFDTL